MSRPTWYLAPLDRAGLAWAQGMVTREHYLRKPVDVRSMPEGYAVRCSGIDRPLGALILGRPEATRCYRASDSQVSLVVGNIQRGLKPDRRGRLPRGWQTQAAAEIRALRGWYGDVEDVESGRVECTRWQVLNLARVWLHPDVQPGGAAYSPDRLPGFTDRRGDFRSTLGSHVLQLLLHEVRTGYLLRRPPCFLDEPYELRWLLSYCDTRIHRGTLYQAAGAQLYRTNAAGIQTWRWPLAPLTPDEDATVRLAAAHHPRSLAHRARRAQCSIAFESAA